MQKSIFDCNLRTQWDQKIIQVQVVGVQNSNFMLLRQTATNDDIWGPGTHELLLKRCFFRHQGKLYVFTSSVPASVLDQQSEDEIREEDADKVALVF